MPTPETALHWQCRECGTMWASEHARDECEALCYDDRWTGRARRAAALPRRVPGVPRPIHA